MRTLAVLLGVSLVGLVGCNEDEDEGYTSQGFVNNGPAGSGERPPVQPRRQDSSTQDTGAGDAAGDAGADASAADAASGDAATADAARVADAAADAGVECAMDGDCVLAVQLNTCDPCPIGATQARIDAADDDCLVAFQGPNVALFEYEPAECHSACGQVSPLCDAPANTAVCADGVCGS